MATPAPICDLASYCGMQVASTGRLMKRLSLARLAYRRRGGIAVELVLVLIVLITVTVGLVQFGLFLANAQQVALAARVGALKASRLAHLPCQPEEGVPEEVVSAIERHLTSSGIAWSYVRLVHNTGNAGDVVRLAAARSPVTETATNDVTSQDFPPFAVRVTVGVPLDQVMPPQLSFFGTIVQGKHKAYERSATYRYELSAP